MTAILVLAGVYLIVHVGVCLPGIRKRLPRTCSGLIPAFLVADSLLAGLLLLEFYFAAIHDQSDGFNLTYAGRVWFERHWGPLNSLGYRDREAVLPEPGQRSLVVLGDSFASGHGVKQAEDRFSNVVARSLGPGWRVYNVAKIGWDTSDEITALRSFPVKPDIVVLSYCLNDIFPAALEAKFPMNFAVTLPAGIMKTFVDHSALADYVYWRLARGGNLAGGADSFWNSLKGAYADPAVWAIQSGLLTELASYCRDNDIKLVAVIFPMLQAPKESAPLTGKVSQALEDHGAVVLDLASVLAGRPARELVVNSLDAHPNEAVHGEVGRLLAARIKALDLSAAK